MIDYLYLFAREQNCSFLITAEGYGYYLTGYKNIKNVAEKLKTRKGFKEEYLKYGQTWKLRYSGTTHDSLKYVGKYSLDELLEYVDSLLLIEELKK
jgi:hypothetical protein